MAEGKEMPGHRKGASAVVDADRIEGAVVRAVQEYERQLGGTVRKKLSDAEVGGEHDQAVDAPAHCPKQRLGLPAVAVGARDDEVVSVVARGDVHAPDDLGKELAVEVGQQDAERARPLRDQTARGAMRDVGETLGDPPDPASRLVPNGALVVQDPRHGGDRNRRRAGDVPDRDAHGPGRPVRPVTLPREREGLHCRNRLQVSVTVYTLGI
jgi:hypothetical protein